ncbi:winged helix-turn-helix domain-containing protein [Aliishimia ponticola]|nr:response regulator transcription factor [Aliishimia ponticola]
MSILLVDSNRDASDRTDALELGADDVLDPGTPASEVAARILAVATRRAGYAGPVLNIGPLRVSLSERKVWWGAAQVKMSPAQYTIFEKLCLNAPHAVSKHLIMGELYGIDEGGEERTIDVFVATLRSRLANAGAPRTLIETIRGRGYRLADVTPEDDQMSLPFDMPVEDFGIPAQISDVA